MAGTTDLEGGGLTSRAADHLGDEKVSMTEDDYHGHIVAPQRSRARQHKGHSRLVDDRYPH